MRPTLYQFSAPPLCQLALLGVMVCWLTLVGGSPVVSAATLSMTPAQQAVVRDKLLSKPLPDDAPAPIVLHPDHLQQLPGPVLGDLQLRSQLLRLHHRDIALRLNDDHDDAQRDLAFLWQHAVERSAAIRYAVQKLGERQHPDTASQRLANTKRWLQTLAQVGGAAGSMWFGNPLGVLTGSMVNQVVSDVGLGAPRPVNDADMVALTKAVEDLQREVMSAYFSYRFANQRLALLDEAERDLLPYYHRALRQYANANSPDAQAVYSLLQSQWQQWQQTQQWVKQQSQQTSSALALLVGPEAVAALASLKQANTPTQAPQG
jgi:hypothetical protein